MEKPDSLQDSAGLGVLIIISEQEEDKGEQEGLKDFLEHYATKLNGWRIS